MTRFFKKNEWFFTKRGFFMEIFITILSTIVCIVLVVMIILYMVIIWPNRRVLREFKKVEKKRNKICQFKLDDNKEFEKIDAELKKIWQETGKGFTDLLWLEDQKMFFWLFFVFFVFCLLIFETMRGLF